VVYKNNLLHNYRLYKKSVGRRGLWPVLKSNAYGHGLVEVAKIFDDQKCEYLIVDSYYEAMILRNEGIKTPILIIGFTFTENILKNRLNKVTFVVGDWRQVQELVNDVTRRTKLHLKVDTGMNRQGIEPEEIKKVLRLMKQNEEIELEGICSHLADADSLDQSETLKQIGVWNELVDKLGYTEKIKYWHCGASSSLFYLEKIKSNAVRLGLGLYGINVDEKKKFDLQTALGLQSVISSIRQVRAGEGVGYNFTFKTKKDRQVATVPVGYFEGVDRRLSNIGFVRVGNIFCPIIGRVSMNIISIDVSEVKEIVVGQDVEVIGLVGKNSVENMAKLTKTIPYEILVHIPSLLKREMI